MRWLFVVCALALVSAGAAGCGDAGYHRGAASHASSSTATSAESATSQPVTPSGATRTTPPTLPPGQRYRNDSDKDQVTDEDKDNVPGNNVVDDDNDEPEDHFHPGNNLYHDTDDAAVVNAGHAASAADRRAVAIAVKSYYAAALAGDGARACSLLVASFARSIPETYGQGANGPPYLRGAKTCAEVMVRYFKHARAQVTSSFVVTGVRIQGNAATALLGSKTVPASSISLARDGGVWKVSALLASQLN